MQLQSRAKKLVKQNSSEPFEVCQCLITHQKHTDAEISKSAHRGNLAQSHTLSDWHLSACGTVRSPEILDRSGTKGLPLETLIQKSLEQHRGKHAQREPQEFFHGQLLYVPLYLYLSHEQWQSFLEALCQVHCIQHLQLLSIGCFDHCAADVR